MKVQSYISLFVISVFVVALSTVSAAPEIDSEDLGMSSGISSSDNDVFPPAIVEMNLPLDTPKAVCEDSSMANSEELPFAPIIGCCKLPPHSDCRFDLDCFFEGRECVKGCPY